MPARTDPVVDWARSGAMALTGRPDGPPRVPPGTTATVLRQYLAALGLDIRGVLGERAAYAGLSRNGPWSCGGAMRVLRALDKPVALSLARPSDVELVPALVESEKVADAWDAVATWMSRVTADEATARFQLLGLPGGTVGQERRSEGAVHTTALGTRAVVERPLVVDLTSLWAGPLCAHLLGLTGARVVKVESTTRPDGARSGSAEFFQLLHDGHEKLVLDFTTPQGRDRLHELIAEADLVLEASRPRALRQLGLEAEEVVRGGTSWLSITACGRGSAAVGFGDDVAARAGMVVVDQGDLLPVGDALADPVAGVRAAVEARAALDGKEARLIDLSMVDLVAESVGPIPDHAVEESGGSWWVESETGRYRVSDPERRR